IHSAGAAPAASGPKGRPYSRRSERRGLGAYTKPKPAPECVTGPASPGCHGCLSGRAQPASAKPNHRTRPGKGENTDTSLESSMRTTRASSPEPASPSALTPPGPPIDSFSEGCRFFVAHWARAETLAAQPSPKRREE